MQRRALMRGALGAMGAATLPAPLWAHMYSAHFLAFFDSMARLDLPQIQSPSSSGVNTFGLPPIIPTN